MERYRRFFAEMRGGRGMVAEEAAPGSLLRLRACLEVWIPDLSLDRMEGADVAADWHPGLLLLAVAVREAPRWC